MTVQTRCEVIKALARGKSVEETADLMEVNPDEVKSVTQAEIDEERAHLKEAGRI